MPRMLWPDTLCAGGGPATCTSSPTSSTGRRRYDPELKDRRQRPYALFRVLVNADPVRLVGEEKSKK